MGLKIFGWDKKDNTEKFHFFFFPMVRIKRSEKNKKIYFLGICIKTKKKAFQKQEQMGSNYQKIETCLWQMQRVCALHDKVFTKFKNKHQGQDIVIVATGPTLNDFIPIKDAVYIGVNRAFSASNVTLDYLFMQDYIAVSKYIEESFPYKNESLIRFYGIEPCKNIDHFMIPESIALRHQALRYYVHSTFSDTPDLPDTFAYDLSCEELYGKGTTVFAALQFALWTNPKRIYLVGCDCSNAGHFDVKDSSQSCVHLIEHYHLFKKFVNDYYPETEIISVNPVGLKGVFKDLYQKKE